MIAKLKNKWNHLTHPIQGEIWCLHRVLPERSNYPSNRELEITPDYLESLLFKYKHKGFRFVSINKFLDAKNVLLNRKEVNVSFDDGFKDVFIYAYPILKKYDIPFTIYLTTDMPEGKADLWWLQMENEMAPEDYECMIKEIYQSGDQMGRKMHELTNTLPDYDLCSKVSLSWDELKEMVDSGLCTIGSHTVSHPGLDRIEGKARVRELLDSRTIIKEKLSVNAIHFSYPHSMQNELVRKAVEEAGYASATLGYGGIVRKGDNPYCLNRHFIIQK